LGKGKKKKKGRLDILEKANSLIYREKKKKEVPAGERGERGEVPRFEMMEIAHGGDPRGLKKEVAQRPGR